MLGRDTLELPLLVHNLGIEKSDEDGFTFTMESGFEYFYSDQFIFTMSTLLHVQDAPYLMQDKNDVTYDPGSGLVTTDKGVPVLNSIEAIGPFRVYRAGNGLKCDEYSLLCSNNRGRIQIIEDHKTMTCGH